jgi:hypothetical protein
MINTRMHKPRITALALNQSNLSGKSQKSAITGAKKHPVVNPAQGG